MRSLSTSLRGSVEDYNCLYIVRYNDYVGLPTIVRRPKPYVLVGRGIKVERAIITFENSVIQVEVQVRC